MADQKQFGPPRVTQFGDRPGADEPGDSTHCAQCEAMLADALDGALSPEDQKLFDEHMGLCGPCAQLLADAKRGAAWLEMLRSPQPEPPAELLAKILEQTSGQAAANQPAYPALTPMPAGGIAPAPAHYGNVVSFPGRFISAWRRNAVAHVWLQPRLAMTAAMAFLSIVLTLDLTGVRLKDLHASDLKPSSLKRDFFSANARVQQYYDSLRVVYELESRVRDLQLNNDANGGTPASAPAKQQTPNQPPEDQPEQPDQQGRQPRQKTEPGRSQREVAQTRLALAELALPEELLPWKPELLPPTVVVAGTDRKEGRLV